MCTGCGAHGDSTIRNTIDFVFEKVKERGGCDGPVVSGALDKDCRKLNSLDHEDLNTIALDMCLKDAYCDSEPPLLTIKCYVTANHKAFCYAYSENEPLIFPNK